MRRALLAAFLHVAMASAALADDFDDAKAAITSGDFDTAQQILAPIVASEPDNVEAQFLQATIATLQERWSDALVLYRRILDQHPDLLRVRLDYARALFEDHQDEEADYNFRLALPNVPEAVAGNIYTFLNRIDARKRFTYSLSVAGGYDTNINAASSLNQLTLFGLNFILEPGAQQKS